MSRPAPLAALLLFALASCTYQNRSVPLPSTAPLERPSPDRARVYVIREAGGDPIPVVCDRERIGSVGNKTYLSASLAPGAHIFCTGIVNHTFGIWGFNTENIAEVPLTLEGGKTYYLRLSTEMGWSGARVILERVEDPMGLSLLGKYKPSPPEDEKEREQAIKQMPVPPGKALLYVLGSGVPRKRWIKVDDTEIGTVQGKNRFLYCILEPGEHRIMQNKKDTLTLDLATGDVAYIAMIEDADRGHMELRQLPATTGRALLIPRRMGKLSLPPAKPADGSSCAYRKPHLCLREGCDPPRFTRVTARWRSDAARCDGEWRQVAH